VQVSARVNGLKSKTTYYYRVLVTTAGGVTAGAVLSFTTE
jgi:phosphodiesterase/alkaline phosphatase D-like protein